MTLFAIWKVFRADADLHNSRLVHTSDADIFEHAIVDFALARRLDHNFLAAGDQRPKCRRLSCFAGSGEKVKSTPVLVR
jgi:hypothetical protein